MATRTPRDRLTRSVVSAAGVNAAVYTLLAVGNRDAYGARAWALIAAAGAALLLVAVLGVRRARSLPADADPGDVARVQRRVGASLLACSLLCLAAFAGPAVALVLAAATGV